METKQSHRRTFADGLRLAQAIARQVADTWQVSDHPQWHGGVEAAREIEQRLREVQRGESNSGEKCT